MKILREVSALKVKRTFLIADHITQRKDLGNNRKFIKDLSEEEFLKRLREAKKEVLKSGAKKLDTLISPRYPKRIKSYNGSRWFLAHANPKELGVWKRAGGLPLTWTNASLFETAEKMKKGLEKGSKLIKRRPKHSIPNILKIKNHLEQKEEYLFPIVFKNGTGTQGRLGLKTRVKGDIDDGCMRAIALAMSGRNPITVYFGVPKKGSTK